MTSAVAGHYATLGVPPTASPAEIKAAYRRRSRLLHPDRNPSAGANRQMAALNDAYAVLSDPGFREEHDRSRPRAPTTPRPSPSVPASGRGAPQPDRLPDWYELLDLHMNASAAAILRAAQQLRREILDAHYPAPDEERLLGQLRAATTTLADPHLRAIYDAALNGTPPPPGTHPAWHDDYYTFLGLPPRASPDRIAGRVTDLSARGGRKSPELRELAAAWHTLRDPQRRAAYDATLDARRA